MWWRRGIIPTSLVRGYLKSGIVVILLLRRLPLVETLILFKLRIEGLREHREFRLGLDILMRRFRLGSLVWVFLLLLRALFLWLLVLFRRGYYVLLILGLLASDSVIDWEPLLLKHPIIHVVILVSILIEQVL